MTVKITGMRASNHAIAAGVNWALLAVIAATLVAGSVAMRVGGFEFAPDAANLFLTKLPVLFLVALLIERTGEIFLTISRGGEAINMEVQLKTLTGLKGAKRTRDARLAELLGKIADCDKAIISLKGVHGKDAELKDQEEQKTVLEKEKGELEKAKAKEDLQIGELENATLNNSKPGTLENRTHALTDYKNRTRSVAMTFNFILALLISACGFRAVEGLVLLHPVDSTPRAAPLALEAAQIKDLTQRLSAQIRADRESLEKATDPGTREILKRQQDDTWAGWLEKELKDKLLTAKPGTAAPGAATASVPIAAALQREIHAFRFFDILLTAGLLAGGADPITRVMKLLRDFLDERNKQLKSTNK